VGVVVRDAVEYDLPALVRFGKHFAKAAPYGGAADETAVVTQLRRCLADRLAFIAEVGGQVVGGIVGISTALWYAPQVRLASELAWWVEPQHRGGSAALRLLRAFEDRARSTGHQRCAMMMIVALGGDTLDKLYKRLGYNLVEQSYLKDIS
jgi:predicted N-acetyltransferase YhbS